MPPTPETPASSSSQQSTEERRQRVRRNLFPDDSSPVQSPEWDQSPGQLDELLNEAILVEEINFDPEAAAAAFFNQMEDDEPIQYEFNVPNQEYFVLEPMEEAVPTDPVPIEPEPVIDADLTLEIQIQNNYFKSAEDEMDEVLDGQINAIEAAMTPPDYNGYIPIHEE